MRNQMKVSILKASSDETPKRTLTQDSQDQSDAESSTADEEVESEIDTFGQAGLTAERGCPLFAFQSE